MHDYVHVLTCTSLVLVEGGGAAGKRRRRERERKGESRGGGRGANARSSIHDARSCVEGLDKLVNEYSRGTATGGKLFVLLSSYVAVPAASCVDGASGKTPAAPMHVRMAASGTCARAAERTCTAQRTCLASNQQTTACARPHLGRFDASGSHRSCCRRRWADSAGRLLTNCAWLWSAGGPRPPKRSLHCAARGRRKLVRRWLLCELSLDDADHVGDHHGVDHVHRHDDPDDDANHHLLRPGRVRAGADHQVAVPPRRRQERELPAAGRHPQRGVRGLHGRRGGGASAVQGRQPGQRGDDAALGGGRGDVRRHRRRAQPRHRALLAVGDRDPALRGGRAPRHGHRPGVRARRGGGQRHYQEQL